MGLPATASTRDITKRISDLETFSELGKTKSYPYDIPALGALDRSLEAIKDAARKIEQIEGRLFHSFFWFRASDGADELALDSLAAGNLGEAAELWDKLLGKDGSKKYTWRLNRGVLHLVSAGVKTLDTKQMDDALECFGFVIDDDLDESIQDVLGGKESGLNRVSLWKRVVDEVVALVQSYAGNPYGRNTVRILESFWSFPSEAKDYASAKIVNPLIEEVKNAIKVSAGLREGDDLKALKTKNHLDKVERIIEDLEEVLSEDDIRFLTIANAYADEVCNCAVKALNKYDNPKLSHMLIQWADSLPSFSRIKTRIEENIEIIQKWVEDEEDNEIFGEVYTKLKVNINTLPQAASMLEDMKRLLEQAKAQVGAADNRYIRVSSSCANYILGFLVSRVNTAQTTFSSTKNKSELKSTIGQATELTRKLVSLDLDFETRRRVDENLRTIVSINASIPSGSILTEIPGWVWLLIILPLLLWMCNGH